MELVSHELLEKLTDQRLRSMCQLYGVVYRDVTVSEKVENLWRELSRREGDHPSRTILVHVPKSVWETVTTSKGESKATLQARQRALAIEYEEDEFQPLRGGARGSSQAVEIYVGTPQKKAAEGTKSEGKRPKTPPALGTDQGGDSEGEELRSEADTGRHPEDEEWATAGPKKRKGKGKKVAADRGDAAGPSRQGAGGGEKGMDNMPKTKKRAEGIGAAKPIPAVLQALGPQFGRVCKTLRAVSEELRRPPGQRDGDRGLTLADRAEDALSVLEAFLMGMETEKLRSALSKAEAPPGAHQSAAKSGPPGADSRSPAGRRWSEVVANPGAISAPRPPRFEWDAGRTVFLQPTDPEAAKRPIDSHLFGANFAKNFRGIPELMENLPHSAVERVDRTPTNGWKVQLTATALKYIPSRAFTVPGVEGAWIAEKMRAPSATSLVVYGIDPRASDEEVATALARGSARLLSPEDAERLKGLRVRRLLARAPSGEGEATGSEAQATGGSRVTRACRVYMPPDLARFFCQRGEMMFDFVGRRVKEYVPTQYYCKFCRRMGSHSSQYHRHSGAVSHTERPTGGPERPTPGDVHRAREPGSPKGGGPQEP